MASELLQLLQHLADLQQLKIAPDLLQIVSQLRGPLEHYDELEFRSDGRRIDLITLSDDLRAAADFLELLRARRLPESALATPSALLRFGAGKVVGMKLPIAGSLGSGELYIRGALPLSEAIYFLEQQGASPLALDRLAVLADTFQKRHLHMLAADAADPPSLTAFFTTYLVPEDNTDLRRLELALGASGISAEGVARLLRLHGLLGANRPKTLFFSCDATGAAGGRVKIDYADVRLGVAAEAMTAAGAQGQADTLLRWGGLLAVKKANYAGVIVGPGGPIAARAYFTRCPPWKNAYGNLPHIRLQRNTTYEDS